jgi:hypothetical protein
MSTNAVRSILCLLLLGINEVNSIFHKHLSEESYFVDVVVLLARSPQVVNTFIRR